MGSPILSLMTTCADSISIGTKKFGDDILTENISLFSLGIPSSIIAISVHDTVFPAGMVIVSEPVSW